MLCFASSTHWPVVAYTLLKEHAGIAAEPALLLRLPFGLDAMFFNW